MGTTPGAGAPPRSNLVECRLPDLTANHPGFNWSWALNFHVFSLLGTLCQKERGEKERNETQKGQIHTRGRMEGAEFKPGEAKLELSLEPLF